MKGQDENVKQNIDEDSDNDSDNDEESAPRLMSVSVGSRITSGLGSSVDKVPSPVLEQLESKFKSNKNVPEINRATWEIVNIPTASSDFRRTRTMIEINGGSIQKIAGILFDNNKTRSIHAVYDNEKATVKCKTSSYMKFLIRLVRTVQAPDSILIEVRRTSGCALAFRDEYQAIVKLVQCEEGNSEEIKSFESLELKGMPDIPVEEDIIQGSLENSILNLKSEVYDARIITLQDLSLTTASESKEITSTACKLIFGKYTEILQYVVTDIMKRVENRSITDDDSDEFERSLNLTILGNLLSAESENETITSLIQNSSWTEKLIETLIWYVDMYSEYPWNACLAAKCLRLLASNSTQHTYNGAYSALESARCYGNDKYNLLEQEAREAQVVIGGTKL